MPRSAPRAVQAGVVYLVSAKPKFGGVFPLETPGSADGGKPSNFFLQLYDIMVIGEPHQRLWRRSGPLSVWRRRAALQASDPLHTQAA